MVEKLQSIFSNREIAAIFWISFVIIVLLTINKGIRTSVLDFLKALFSLQIRNVLLFALVYVEFVVYLLSLVKMWNLSLIKDSIFWFILSAIVILFHLN